MTYNLYSDPEAHYTGPDLKQHVINTPNDGIYHYRIPVEKFANEEAKQKYAESFMLVRYGLQKGKDYVSATISDEGIVMIQPNNPIEYIEFNLGVVTKDNNETTDIP